MQDPERLLDAGTEFERALLRGAVVERPSARTLRRMALGAGVGGALSYSSSAKALLQTWWSKTVAVAVVGGGVAAGVVGSLHPEAALPPKVTPVVSSAPATAALPAPPRVEQPVTSLSGSAVEAPAPGEIPARAPAKRASGKPAPPRATSPASTLADEVKQLDRVRGSMGRGDRAAALIELDAYDRRYPQGTLRREARVLRARVVEQQ